MADFIKPQNWNPDNCGIYRIVSPSGSFYIGSSSRISKRWTAHRCALKNGRHTNKALQRAWDKYNGNLIFEKIIVCEPEFLLLREQEYIDDLQPEYNMAPVAGSMLGVKHGPTPPERRAKISAANKGKMGSNRGKKFSDEHRARMSASMKEHHVDPEYRKKISELRTGKRLSEQQRQRMSETHKARFAAGAINSFLGKKHSIESRAAMGERMRGKPGFFTGKTHSEETKKKIKEKRSSQVIIHSEATKLKFVEAARTRSSLSIEDVRKIRELAGSVSRKHLSEMFGVGVDNIGAIIKRKTWKDV